MSKLDKDEIIYGLRDRVAHQSGEIDLLKERLENYLKVEVPIINTSDQHEPTQTLAFNRVLQRAVAHVQSSTSRSIPTLVALGLSRWIVRLRRIFTRL